MLVSLDKQATAHRSQITLTHARGRRSRRLAQVPLLPRDDLLSLVRNFLSSDASRSGLDRGLR